MEKLRLNIDKICNLAPIDYKQLDDTEKKEHLMLINSIIQKIAERMHKVENPDLNALYLLEITIDRLCRNYEMFGDNEEMNNDPTLKQLTIHSKQLLAETNKAISRTIKGKKPDSTN